MIGIFAYTLDWENDDIVYVEYEGAKLSSIQMWLEIMCSSL